jgi:hypothetical protein
MGTVRTMSILGPFDTPLALEVRTRCGPTPDWTIAPPAPPARVHDDDERALSRPDLDTARFLTRTLLGTASDAAAVVAELEAAVDEHVVTWSPSMYTTSRRELVAELLERDDAVDDIVVSLTKECLTETGAFVMWRVSGRFDRPGFLRDDVLIEPSHRRIESAGVVVLSFAGPRIERIECYYDALTLLEQVLPPG